MPWLAKRLHLHICRLDKECRRWGAPNRVSLRLGTHWFSLALNRDSKFVGNGPGDFRRDYWFDHRKN